MAIRMNRALTNLQAGVAGPKRGGYGWLWVVVNAILDLARFCRLAIRNKSVDGGQTDQGC